MSQGIDDRDLPFRPPVQVLFVQEHPAQGDVLEAIFKGQPVEIIRAQSSDEAQNLAADHPFAVILVETSPTKADGFATAAQIRRCERHRHTPIIFIRALGDDRLSRAEVLELGSVDFLTTPLDPVCVRAKVHCFIDLFLAVSELKSRAEQMRLQDRKLFHAMLHDENFRLRESESRKAAILETALDAIITIDSEGKVLEFNPAAERIFGFTRAQVLGQNLAEFIIPPSLRGQHRLGLARYVSTGEGRALNQRMEMPALRADGTEIFVEFAITRTSPDPPPVFTAYLRDITAQKRQERRRAARLAVNQVLATSSSFAEAAPLILQAICENLLWDVGAIWELEPEADVLRCFEIWHRPALHIPEFTAVTRAGTFAKGQGLPGRIWASGQPTWIPDVSTDDNFPRGPYAVREGLRGAFGFPIVLGQEFFGVVEFFSHRIQMPDADKFEMAGTIGSQIGQFIERTRAYEMVRDVSQKLQIVTESMAALVTRCSREFRYLWVSPRYAQWMNSTPEALANQPIVDVIGAEAFEQLVPRFEEVLSGRQVHYEDEVEFEGLGKRWIRATYSPTFDLSGNPDGWVAVVEDTTARKAMEEALRDSEQRFSLFMEQLPGLAWIKDTTGRYVYANSLAVSVFGTPSSQLLGKSDADIFPAEAADQFEENDRKALESETGIQVIESLRHHDGTIHKSIVNKFSIRGPHGNPLFIGGIAIDITDRLNAEEALRDADRRKDHFLAMLAHELRNPLAPLRSGLELMRDAKDEPLVIERTRNIMERQLGHMVRLIDDLLDISRINQGKLQLRRDRVQLAPILQDAIEASRRLIDAREHQLTVEITPQAIFVDADPTRLAQVFSNLLTNAAKYTNKRGHIALTTRLVADEVLVTVRDNGMGIDRDQLPRIFEMFAQLEPKSRQSHDGLGVGLGLARALVELHEGTIDAHSEGPDRGSEFLVRLPVLKDAASAPRECGEPEAELALGLNRRVLVVDDNQDAANSLALLLKLQGLETHTAYEGHQAVEVASRLRPDTILMDIGMPNWSGYDVALYIRQQEWGQNIRLIAISGWGQEDDKRRALECGFSAHLTKPVQLAHVVKFLAADRAVPQAP